MRTAQQVPLCPLPKKLHSELETIEEVNKHRKVNCAFYDNCLDTASVFCWQSFSCIDCMYYIEEPRQLHLAQMIDSLKNWNFDELIYKATLDKYLTKKKLPQEKFKKITLSVKSIDKPKFPKYKLKLIAN